MLFAVGVYRLSEHFDLHFMRPSFERGYHISAGLGTRARHPIATGDVVWRLSQNSLIARELKLNIDQFPWGTHREDRQRFHR